MKVVWEGSFFIWHSLAHVNRELASRLAKLKAVDAIASNDRDLQHALAYPHGAELKKLQKKVKGPSVSIRHAFPPNFCPHDGPVILMQPWEFLRAPMEWVEAVKQGLVSELWCNSNFTRNNYVLSGVPPEKVRVLPLGYDHTIFKPEGKKADVGEPDEFKFLFVGGTIERKGIDILMRAFLAEFRRQDSVRLIVKDTGTKHVYIHNNQSEPIRKVVEDPRAPRVTYIDEDMPPQELAELMRACDIIAQPYRAEGFCLPVLEGMACQLAPLVTYGGPTDDFVLNSVGWKVASQRTQIAQIPGLQSADDQGWMEPDQRDVQRALREAFENRQTTNAMGQRAAVLAKEFTWDAVAKTYASRITAVQERTAVQAARKRPTISLCMIVRDEERVIRECLDSVNGVFDEIIVVDTGSTDRTMEICKEFDLELRQFEWIDDFSAARNESMRGAKGDYIFFVDADDTLPANTAKAVREAVEIITEDVSGFIVPVRFLDGTQVDHVKLFRNLQGLTWRHRIHEQILGSLNEVHGGRVARIPNVHVLHSGYDTSPEGQAKKRERDWKILDLELLDRPEHPFSLFCYAMTEHHTGRFEASVARFEHCLSVSNPTDSHVRKAYSLMGQAQISLGQLDVAKATFSKGLEAAPGDPELLFFLAKAESETHDFDAAAAHYRQIFEAQPDNFISSFDHGILGFKTWHNLGNVELGRGNYETAKEAFLRALEDRPEFTASALSLFDAALKRKDVSTVKLVHDHVQRVEGLSEAWVEMLSRVAPDPEPILRDILSSQPDVVPVRMELARRLLNTARQQEAIPHLRLMSDQGLAEAAFFLGVVSQDQGNTEDSKRWFVRADQLNPGHAETLRRLSMIRESPEPKEN